MIIMIIFKIKKKNQKNIQYKPINEYKEVLNTIYDDNDLDLFQNKIDSLF